MLIKDSHPEMELPILLFNNVPTLHRVTYRVLYVWYVQIVVYLCPKEFIVIVISNLNQ